MWQLYIYSLSVPNSLLITCCTKTGIDPLNIFLCQLAWCQTLSVRDTGETWQEIEILLPDSMCSLVRLLQFLPIPATQMTSPESDSSNSCSFPRSQLLQCSAGSCSSAALLHYRWLCQHPTSSVSSCQQHQPRLPFASLLGGAKLWTNSQDYSHFLHQFQV